MKRRALSAAPELARVDMEGLPYRVRRMEFEDIGQVMEIERLSFSSPWPASAYRHELRQRDMAHYFVLEAHPSGGGAEDERPSYPGGRLRRWVSGQESTSRILGYGGFWLVRGEAHISTIAVHPELRGRGLGELMLLAMLEEAVARGAETATLEVRASNFVAQNLYRKCGFIEVGLRHRYYHDNEEDAVLMRSDDLTSASFQAQFQVLKAALRERLERDAKEKPPS